MMFPDFWFSAVELIIIHVQLCVWFCFIQKKLFGLQNSSKYFKNLHLMDIGNRTQKLKCSIMGVIGSHISNSQKLKV